ncbi:long-chain-fatty-acid--CoA ligase [Paraburkholderia saeva]|uniref:3-[(3aS,4S,7aS)-7a-methyl-1, 5-dioxo-octahydro-1H-inden-4-yl]propanoyl:CoA ligase n=1 Tax=Paraburkholderia saeva TaxID=2777537 RepID=A0A9N8RSJ2_9BURK|nr:long-chain-fatty-acid--CoA ligase [Paraburkholderia saeva]CAG4886850.1 3-[(3aS,4S,7aS)-7a-methyl-1, 5-dioxo-octahydro-1H-inden-4-yl]propanoyl:CoA ligase [Paraburkholderia saeva]CAG4887141.1 3-[(3aS,4S,7aS)-7a-methyl-1, 5-dioxo-octahydro-1H-inden-4-yl]propanoyl:CoA ligase [Paraburkholderia saeva]
MYLTQGLHRSVQQRPNATAIHFDSEARTFAELGARVARLAGALRQLGVGNGERVAMLSVNSPRYIEYYMATPWAGGVLNPLNIRWSASELLYALNDSGTSILIVDETFRDLGLKLAREAATLRHVIYAGDDDVPEGMLSYESLIAQSEAVEDAGRQGDDLAGIFYTGGTTGFPKGVMLSHTNLGVAMLATLAVGHVVPGTVFLHAMPMFHLAGFAAINALLACGGVHVVTPAFTPQTTMEAISKHGVNRVMLAPTMLQMMLDWIDNHPDQSTSLNKSSLTRIMYGASPISQSLLRRAQKMFPKAEFVQGYGMTELSPVCASLGAEYHTDEAYASGKMRAAGRPLMCVEVRIVDSEDREVPRGTTGEIIVRGPNVMLGYWNLPEATAETLRNGWMHTGDGGYMDDDGLLYVVDRLKDMIVSGGENIYSAEVENAISSHPAVAQCAVIGIPNDRWGESVHAVIVAKPGEAATAEDIQAHCRERIAGYKCPRSVEFRESLPISPVGKIQKNTLRETFWSNRKRGVA